MTTKNPKRRLSRRAIQRAISSSDVSLLEDCDQRFQATRRLANLTDNLFHDFGGHTANAAQVMLVRRAALLALQCELHEADWARAQRGRHLRPMTDRMLRTYSSAVSALRRTLFAINQIDKQRTERQPQVLTLAQAEAALVERGLPIPAFDGGPTRITTTTH